MEWWEQTAGRLNGRFVHLPAILLFIGKSGQQDIDPDIAPWRSSQLYILISSWIGMYNTDTLYSYVFHCASCCVKLMMIANQCFGPICIVQIWKYPPGQAQGPWLSPAFFVGFIFSLLKEAALWRRVQRQRKKYEQGRQGMWVRSDKCETSKPCETNDPSETGEPSDTSQSSEISQSQKYW